MTKRLEDISLSRIVIESVAEKSLSFSFKRLPSDKLKRETCYPLTFEHRPPLYCGAVASPSISF